MKNEKRPVISLDWTDKLASSILLAVRVFLQFE